MLYASMAEYADYLQRLNASPKVSLMNSNMEMLRQLPGLNSSSLENSNVAGFTADSFLAYHYQHYPELLSAVLVQKNHSSASHPHLLSVAESFVQTVTSNQNVLPLNESRKAVGQSSSSCKNTSCITSTSSTKNNNKGSGRCKKRKSTEKETDQAEEIIHVRAKRGQATDSHSIAERVRREKINNKLRCLQEIVPGCNKSMGMAVMLEEIINYVHSLQNQVEFLSMELAAASCSYNLNMEAESYMQRTNSPEGLEMQKWSRERCREISSFCSTWSI